MKLTKRNLSAILLLFLVILLIFFFVVLPLYAKYQNTNEEIASLQHRIMQYKRISSKNDGLTNELDNLQVFNENQEYYLVANKPTLASAELQNIIKDILNSEEVKTLSMQTVNSGILDVRQIKLSVHCRADIINLHKLLYQIETNVPTLIIDKVSIGRGFSSTFRDRQSTNTTDVLDVRFDVSAYMAQTTE